MPTFSLQTDKPIAFDSPDHTHPCGTKQDNSRNPAFNLKLYALFKQLPIRVLDIGCAGGGFVKDCIDDGQFAVGLEGSDYSKLAKRAEWATIPDNLFTCDCTHPFQVFEDGKPAKFTVVTAWEFMEHIEPTQIKPVCENVKKHLAEGGIWLMSINTAKFLHHGTPLHRTVYPYSWWANVFSRWGFVRKPDIERHFGKDWIRGPEQDEPHSFNLALSLPSQAGTSPRPL